MLNLAKDTRSRALEMRAKFAAAHKKWMDALARHDFDTMGDAVREEADLIQQQAEMIDLMMGAVAPAISRGKKIR
jgi:hypothetical protein